MRDVEGHWDVYPNLRLKIKFFLKWLNCAISFVKFATLSRSGGTTIPNADFHHLYNHFIYSRRPLRHRNIGGGGLPLEHVELFMPSHRDTKSTLPLCHKLQMLSQTVQQAVA